MILKFPNNQNYNSISENYQELKLRIQLMNALKKENIATLDSDQCALCFSKHKAHYTLYYQGNLLHICDICRNEIIENKINDLSIKKGLFYKYDNQR